MLFSFLTNPINQLIFFGPNLDFSDALKDIFSSANATVESSDRRTGTSPQG